LYKEIHDSLLDINKSLDRFRPQPESETLVLATFHAFAALWLIPRLGNFYQKHPEIRTQIVIGNSLIDLARDSSIDLAIRCTRNDHQKLFQKNLIEEQFCAYISPIYKSKLDSGEIQLITTKWETPAPVQIDWNSWCDQAGVAEWLKVARFREFSDEHYALQAALCGQGAVLASTVLVADQVAAGTLLPLRSDTIMHGATYKAVCIPGRERHPPVSKFLKWVTEEISR